MNLSSIPVPQVPTIQPSSPSQPLAPLSAKTIYQVTFNVTFEGHSEAMAFARIMLQHIQDFDSPPLEDNIVSILNRDGAL